MAPVETLHREFSATVSSRSTPSYGSSPTASSFGAVHSDLLLAARAESMS